jgi:hypothetical protein
MFCYSLSTYSSHFRSACGLIFRTLFISNDGFLLSHNIFIKSKIPLSVKILFPFYNWSLPYWKAWRGIKKWYRCPEFSILVVLEFELRASCLLDRCSTASAIPPTLCALVILEIETHFCPVWPGLQSFCFTHNCCNCIVRMTGTQLNPAIGWYGSLVIFLLGLASNRDPPDLNLVARITGVSCQCGA